MKTFVLYLLIVGVSHAASITFDAGGSYVTVTGAKYETNPDPYKLNEDRRTWTPHVGATVALTEQIAIRIGYQFVNGLETKAEYPYAPSRPPGSVIFPATATRGYHSDIHILGLGPQLRIPLSQSLTAVVSPELNWVMERGEVRDGTFLLRDRNIKQITFGAFVSLRQKLTERWSVEVGYRYVDAEPSWNRKLSCPVLGFGFR